MPAKLQIVPGKRYEDSRLVIVREVNLGKGRQVLCRCDCGKLVIRDFKGVRTLNVRSCGCLRSEIVATKNRKHGLRHRLEYGHWKGMRQRCTDPNHIKYPRYGGVGIKVCRRWDDFAKFLEDLGPIPSPQYSLDRFPNRHGNYEPGNVRWATASDQVRNRDCMDEHQIEFNGQWVLLVEIAEKAGIPVSRLRHRLRRGWTLEEAITKPSRGSRYD